jgi:hypothetical protein
MQSWYLYGLMDILKGFGSIPVRTLETKARGSTLELGDIEVHPGYRLTGQQVRADGQPVLPGTRVLVSRQQAWDSQTATVGPDEGNDPRRRSTDSNNSKKIYATGSPSCEILSCRQRAQTAHPVCSSLSASSESNNPWHGTLTTRITPARMHWERPESPESSKSTKRTQRNACMMTQSIETQGYF